MSRLCVIPARGGSKRVPRKNIRDFLGRPMLAWPVAAALESGLFDRVMVSTEDAEIAEVARSAGAEVPFLRRPETADDHTGLVDVLAEVVADYAGHDFRPDTVACVLATAALVTPDRLREAARVFEAGGFDTLFTAVRYGAPIQRALTVEADGRAQMIDPSSYAARSQDLTPAWHDAGQVYFARRTAVEARQPLLQGNCGALPVDELHAQDIDTEGDWRLAELKRRLMDEAAG